MPAWQWIVAGRVQGVGFRWYVHRNAIALGLGGFARNLPTGEVEVVANGSTGDLETLDALLRVGPRPSRVDRVEKLEYPHDLPTDKSFIIK